MHGINKDKLRLVHNQRSLFEVMPEMVLLVHGDASIEYMNPSAKIFFGDLYGQPILPEVQSPTHTAYLLLQRIKRSLKKRRVVKKQQFKIHDICLEYILAPFKGYRGDNLHWIFLREVASDEASPVISEYPNTNKHLDAEADIETAVDPSNNALQPKANGSNLLLADLESITAWHKRLDKDSMVGSSKPLQDLREMIKQVAPSDATILITGESGTGKELVADMVREASKRHDKPFLKINCNTINDSLLESDLFGHEKGAFTGAACRRKGKFEEVDGGTIFLDEIGDISPRMQSALLRVLQDGEIIRVGGNLPITVDVRVIAATNTDLQAAVQNGTFRLDLYYRLNIINIAIPPLRERKEDIIDLVSHFIHRYEQEFSRDIKYLSESYLYKLKNHDWPGNVRELENIIQRSVLMAQGSTIHDSELFSDNPADNGTTPVGAAYLERLIGLPLKTIISEFEQDVITYSLWHNRGDIAATTHQLQIGKTALYDKMKRYGISAKDHRR